MNNIEIEYVCPHCHKDIFISCEIDSPSDYCPENFCGHCGKEIKDDKLDAKIMDEVSEYFIDRMEYYRDCINDR